jgi:hypothetical protein
MTLQEFLDATSAVPDTVLRRAMVAALAIEPARSSEACRRFYVRVVRELGLDRMVSASLAEPVLSSR